MHGLFTTPEMRRIADAMDKIETAAAARSESDFYPVYTVEEFRELVRLDAEYKAVRAAAGL